jgi:pseudaminic acid synthase|tara:strand:+ start:3045 stop:4061 length:1017 start_codon:yes stop_codon:yes gene_type:complete
MFKNLSRPYIIAEISGNHNGSIDRAKELVKLAKENGADCVKIQTYTPDTMTIKSNKDDFLIKGGLWDGYNLWDLYDWAQTPFEWQKELFEYANSIGITMISTPFDESAVDLLESLSCPFYKVASFELTDLPLIKYIAQTKKPIILSTGMANEKEIKEAIDIITQYGSGDFILLHCVSGYPTPVEEINLDTITLLKKKFKCEIGLSDHTLGNTSAILSIALGAKVIEKHFTFDRSEGGPDAEFSMEPHELKDLSENISLAHKAIGVGSFEMKSAEESNIKFRRSIYVVNDIKKGDVFTKENIRRIRPGYGLEPKDYEKIIGLKAKRDLEEGNPLTKKDF